MISPLKKATVQDGSCVMIKVCNEFRPNILRKPNVWFNNCCCRWLL